MATDLERLVVQLSADIKKYENSLSRAMGVTNRQAKAIESRFARMSKTINASSSMVGANITKAFALIGGAQGLRTLSDSATRITNSLKVAGLSGEELEATYQDLKKSAIDNAAPLETLVELYGRLSLVQGELGVSSQQLRTFVKDIGMSLRAGGTSTEQASGALTQLAQTLGSGTVRAEEFQSILEGAPTILQAAANGIKQAEGSVAKLRQIMLAGNLSSRALFDGIAAGAPVIQDKLGGATLTIDQRLENLRTSMIDAVRRFNESTAAAETFGAEIDRTARFLATVDVEHIISELQRVISALNSGTAAATAWLAKLGEISGFDGIGRDIVNMLPGEGASKSFFGGGLTVTSTAGITDRINQAFEGQIEKAGELTSEAIQKSVLGSGKGDRLPPQLPAAGPTPTPKPTQVVPIDLDAPQYKPTGGSSKKTKGSGSKTDDYAREIQQLKDRTTALQAETDAQEGLNPLVNDYGFAVEKAAAKHDLLTAAQEAGKKVTPELAAQIETLSTAYANAVVESQKLAESQDLIKERAEEARDFNKDLTRGIIDGFRQGKSAADVFADALSKISDRLLDMAINGIFDSPSKGGLGLDLFGLIGSIFKREKGGPVRKGQPYIVGEKRPELFVPNQSGTIVPKLPTAPSLPNPSQMASSRGGATPSITYAPSYNVQGSGPEIAQLKQQMAKDKADFYPKVIQAVRKGKNSLDL